MPDNLHSIGEVASISRPSHISVPSKKKNDHSQEHRRCSDGIPIEKTVLLLDIHYNCESDERSNIDEAVEPVEKPGDLLGTRLVHLVRPKRRDIRFDASGSQGEEEQCQDKASRPEGALECLHVSRRVVIRHSGQERRPNKIEESTTQDNVETAAVGISQPSAKDWDEIASPYQIQEEEGRRHL